VLDAGQRERARTLVEGQRAHLLDRHDAIRRRLGVDG
jgi:hypothetical protein